MWPLCLLIMLTYTNVYQESETGVLCQLLLIDFLINYRCLDKDEIKIKDFINVSITISWRILTGWQSNMKLLNIKMLLNNIFNYQKHMEKKFWDYFCADKFVLCFKTIFVEVWRSVLSTYWYIYFIQPWVYWGKKYFTKPMMIMINHNFWPIYFHDF